MARAGPQRHMGEKYMKNIKKYVVFVLKYFLGFLFGFLNSNL